MIALHNGCFRSEIKVTPANWKSVRATTKTNWRIWYRFYDPANREKWGKMFTIAFFNTEKILADRKAIVKALITELTYKMDTAAWNPITGKYYDNAGASGGLIDALWWAFDKITMVHGTRVDVRSVINGVDTAARELYDHNHGCFYNNLEVRLISRRHIKDILAKVGEQRKKTWSANRFNKYKAYLSTLFRELLEAEMVDSNPCRDISSKKAIQKKTETLTEAETKLVNDHLFEKHYNFWRYMQIFFHSGARTTELLELRKEAVRLGKQEFTVTVRKGVSYREDTRIISDAVLPLWRQLMKEAEPGDYLFSRLLIPGKEKIRKDQPGRRWAKYVIRELGIKKRFYSLKHLHTDMIAEKLGLDMAAASAGHTTPIITLKHYATGEKQRQRDALKKVDVKL